jgi:MoxR-like ATPase
MRHTSRVGVVTRSRRNSSPLAPTNPAARRLGSMATARTWPTGGLVDVGSGTASGSGSVWPAGKLIDNERSADYSPAWFASTLSNVTIEVDADGTPAHESSGGFRPGATEPTNQIFTHRPDAAASRGFAVLFDAIVSNIEQVIHGKTEAVELAIMCMLAEGHLLIEDVPGVGKTSLAKALSASVDCTWKRVQFTPDLLPTDLVGVSVYQRSTESFRFEPGPMFANIVLADEINRASPKTQSALLEAMEERQVTVDGKSRPLAPPFMVIATQNPVDQEGTYRLPESQLDRFLLRLSVGYPGRDAEIQMLNDQGSAHKLRTLSPVVSAAEILEMVDAVRSVYVAGALKSYLVDIAEASRRHPGIELGLSPRATLQLAAATRGHAAARGRNYATPDDVKAVGIAALAHRIMVRTDRGAHLSPEDAVREVFEAVAVPIAR